MKTPLYDKQLNESNRERAMTGPHGKHPAFSALKELQGVEIGLQRMAGISNAKTLKTIAPALAKQMAHAWAALKKAAQTEGASRKETMQANMRLAEAVAAYFQNRVDDPRTFLILSTLVKMQTGDTEWSKQKNKKKRKLLQFCEGERPTQIELRKKLLELPPPIIFNTDKEWYRFRVKTGLDKSLPTKEQKAAGKVPVVRPPGWKKQRNLPPTKEFSAAELKAAAEAISERKRARKNRGRTV